jgi:hypothetical protein
VSTSNLQLSISYSQLGVFDARLKRPFNDWTARHVRQGFAWRKRSVSFRTLHSGGLTVLSIINPTSLSLLGSCVRAITVPFEVTEGMELAVASIGQELGFDLEPAVYQLTFEHGILDNQPWVRLHFIQTAEPVFLIVRQDAELCPEEHLLTTANPA